MVDVTSFRVVSPKAVSTPVFQLPQHSRRSVWAITVRVLPKSGKSWRNHIPLVLTSFKLWKSLYVNFIKKIYWGCLEVAQLLCVSLFLTCRFFLKFYVIFICILICINIDIHVHCISNRNTVYRILIVWSILFCPLKYWDGCFILIVSCIYYDWYYLKLKKNSLFSFQIKNIKITWTHDN